MKDKPTKDYKAMFKRYQEAHTTPIKVDSLSNVSVDQKTKRGMGNIKSVLIKDIADMKTALIKWTIIILIAACVFYFVYPKYTFRFPTANKLLLYKANKITGTVEVYYRDKAGRWSAR
jgi:hypothetical protein